jgi:hypothetical protein
LKSANDHPLIYDDARDINIEQFVIGFLAGYDHSNSSQPNHFSSTIFYQQKYLSPNDYLAVDGRTIADFLMICHRRGGREDG